MEITVTLPYLVQKRCENTIKVSDDGLQEYLESQEIFSKDDLTNEIYEYFQYESDIDFMKNIDDYDEAFYEDMNISEIKELVEQYTYLIKSRPKTKWCCGEYRISNYCPH